MSKLAIIKEFFIFAKQNKKLWLLPLIILLVLLGMCMVIIQTSSVSPFIYAVF